MALKYISICVWTESLKSTMQVFLEGSTTLYNWSIFATLVSLYHESLSLHRKVRGQSQYVSANQGALDVGSYCKNSCCSVTGGVESACFAVSSWWRFPLFCRRDIEQRLGSLILATDINRQNEFLMTFREHLDNQDLDLQLASHRHFILQV